MSEERKWEKKDLTINELKLWDENARFPDKYFGKTEQELVNYFLSKKNFKIKELAKEIVGEFDLPQLEKLVVYETRGINIVLEGNRRLTVYKLLLNPSLAQEESLKTFFESLGSGIVTKIGKNFKIESNVTTDKDEGLRFVDRKHNKGNNEVDWGDQERANHSVRRGSAKKRDLFKVAMSKVLKGLEVPEDMKEKVLDKGFVSTFYRIIGSVAAYKLFAFNLGENGDLKIGDGKFKEKLKVIILNILEGKSFSGQNIDSRSLNRTQDIKSYISSIGETEIKKAEAYIQRYGLSKNEKLGSEKGKTDQLPERNSFPKKVLPFNFKLRRKSVDYPDDEALKIVEFVCEHFDAVANQLLDRYDTRPTLKITDEYDVQDLLLSVLRLFFDDVRKEDGVPSTGASSSRVDFLLFDNKTVIEVKTTVPRKGAKKTITSLLEKEINDDLIKYTRHPDCKYLLFFIYDPEKKVVNPAGLKKNAQVKIGQIKYKKIIINNG